MYNSGTQNFSVKVYIPYKNFGKRYYWEFIRNLIINTRAKKHVPVGVMVKDIAGGAERLGFHSRVRKIGNTVAHGSYRSDVPTLLMRYAPEMGPARAGFTNNLGRLKPRVLEK